MFWNVESKLGEVSQHKCNDNLGSINFSSFQELSAHTISDQYSVKYVICGEEHYVIDEKEVTVKTGQFIVVKPNQRLKVRIKSQSNVLGLCTYFNPQLINNQLNLKLPKGIEVPNVAIEASLLPLLNTIAGSNIKNVQTKVVLDKAINQFVPFLGAYNNLNSLNAVKANTRIGLWENLESAKNYIKDNLDKDLNLYSVANKACMSPYHFHRSFKAFYKLTPAQYVVKKRLLLAKQLRKSSFLSDEEIALKCGYLDVKYFKKCLKHFLKNEN